MADLSGRVRILSGGRQLQISIAEMSDAASYTCIASNVAGSAKKEYSLKVYGKLPRTILFIVQQFCNRVTLLKVLSAH